MKAINLIINILKVRSQNKLIEKINHLCESKTEDAEQLYNYIFNDEREAIRSAALKKINNISVLLEIEEKQIFSLENSPKEFNLLQRKIHLEKFHYCLQKDCSNNLAEKYLKEFSNKELLELTVSASNKDLALEAFALLEDNELRFKLFRKSTDKKLLQKIIVSLNDNQLDLKLLKRLEKSAPNIRLQKIAQEHHESLKTNHEEKNQPNIDLTEQNLLKTEQKEKIKLYEATINELDQLHQQIKSNTEQSNLTDFKITIEKIKDNWQQLPQIPAEYHEILTISFTKEKVACQKALTNAEVYFNQHEAVLSKLDKISEEVNEKLADIIIDNGEDFQKYEKYINKFEKNINSINEKYHDFIHINDVKLKIEKICSQISNAKNQLKIINDTITTQLQNMVNESNEMLNVLDDNHEIKEKSNELLETLNRKVIMTNHSDHNSLINNLRRNLKSIKNHLINEYHSNDLARWQNYTEKLKLCEAVEALNTEENLHLVAKKLKKYRESWSKIGAVPQEKNEEIWQRFQKNTNELFSKCNEFYDSLKEQQTVAVDKKRQLINKAQELVNSEEFTKAAKEFANLFEEWKIVGYVGDKTEEENLFKEFKELNDKFYKRKQQFFSDRSKKFHDNAEAKKLLIEEAKNLLHNDKDEDKISILNEAKKLRRNWKNVGSTKRDQEENLWHEFNHTINQIFDNLNGDKNENFTLKSAIIDKLDDFKTNFLANLKDDNCQFDFSEFKNLRNEFFKIGNCEKESEKQLQEKFSSICKVIFEEQDLIYEKYFTERENIIEELESIYLEIQKNTTNVEIVKSIIKSTKNLQQKWQSFNLPKSTKDSQEQWERFQALGNNIFAVNKKLFAEENDNREKNYQEKLSLCLQLESIVSKFTAASDEDKNISLSESETNNLALELEMALTNNAATDINNLKSATKEVKNINNKWQQIGAVPSQKAEEIYSRYRDARKKFLALCK